MRLCLLDHHFLSHSLNALTNLFMSPLSACPPLIHLSRKLSWALGFFGHAATTLTELLLHCAMLVFQSAVGVELLFNDLWSWAFALFWLGMSILPQVAVFLCVCLVASDCMKCTSCHCLPFAHSQCKGALYCFLNQSTQTCRRMSLVPKWYRVFSLARLACFLSDRTTWQDGTFLLTGDSQSGRG